MLALVMMLLPALAYAQEAPAPVLKTENDRLSDAMGMDFGNQMKPRSQVTEISVLSRPRR